MDFIHKYVHIVWLKPNVTKSKNLKKMLMQSNQRTEVPSK